MARQPAIELGVPFLVARDAESHLKIHALQAVHGGHIAVALRTVEFPPPYVRLVVELDEVRDEEDLYPGDRGLRVQVLLLLHQLRMGGDDVLVTEETLLHFGKPRVFGPFHVRVTEAAVDLLHASVHPVAEIDGLNRAEAFVGERSSKSTPSPPRAGPPPRTTGTSAAPFRYAYRRPLSFSLSVEGSIRPITFPVTSKSPAAQPCRLSKRRFPLGPFARPAGCPWPLPMHSGTKGPRRGEAAPW